MAGTVKERVQADLRIALGQRDQVVVGALRIALGVLANAEAQPVAEVGEPGLGAFSTDVSRRDLTDDDVRALLQHEVDELGASAAVLRDHGQPERATELTAQADVLRRYL